LLEPWGSCRGIATPPSAVGASEGSPLGAVGGAEIEISNGVRRYPRVDEARGDDDRIRIAKLLDRFYSSATDVLIREDAMVDKFVGDEVMALFIPAFAGERHAEHAISAAAHLLSATGHGNGDEPWVPVGAGVHTGMAYVGAVGSEGLVTDVTALGDSVNTTARLASSAGAGEILVTPAAAEAAGLRSNGIELRSLSLKGKSNTVQAYALRTDDQILERLKSR
jgi:adenylate cyclase